MASGAMNMNNIQIAITSTNEFLQDIPGCFEVGSDSKLHHQLDAANVFAHKKKIFADTSGEALKVKNLEEFAVAKQRLLSLPIYLQVRLERHQTHGRATTVTHADYIIMVNTKQPDIQTQLLEKLNEVEALMKEGKNFLVKIKFGGALKRWFHTQFQSSGGKYYARNSSFCITNFGQRHKAFKNPFCRVYCLLCCLIVAPIYCVYRAIRSEDTYLKVQSSVTHVKGTTPAQRAEIHRLIQAAYIQGLTSSAQNEQMDQQLYCRPHQTQSALPGYSHMT